MMDESKYMYPKVSIIILNWNSWKDTIECLESLYQINYPNYNVILVDNNSQNDSIEKIKRYCEGEIPVESKFFKYNQENKPITIIEYTREEAEFGGGKENEIKNLPSNRKLIIIKNEKNYGFAEGSNIGIRYTLKSLNPDYVLLLNNDTVVDIEFLQELIKIADSDHKIGIIGPKIYQYYSPNKLQETWNKIYFNTGNMFSPGTNTVDHGEYDTVRDTDSVPGACFLIKRKTIEKIGLLDPIYYCYLEDTDYSTRAKKRGWRIIYCPKAKIWHKSRGSTKEDKLGFFNRYYFTRNKFIFMKKHASNWQLLSFLLYFFGFQFWLSCGAYLIYRRNIKKFISFFRGVIDGLKKLRSNY